MDSAPPPLTNTPSQSTSVGIMAALGVPLAILGAILAIMVTFGAAKLSHDRYGSLFWAVVAFIFSPIYYPYYAFFVSKPVYMVGARRR